MIEINRISTKAVRKDGLQLHYRQEEDIYRLVHYIVNGNMWEAPIYVWGKGITLYPHIFAEQIAAEMLYIQQIYQKCRGLRIRHEFAYITKDEFPDQNQRRLQICQIADWYGDYYFYSGFQCVYGVFESVDRYIIRYAINTVSPMDGAKYMYNENEILAMEQSCLEYVVGEVTGRKKRWFDFRRLEYY
ncbi:MAG TPA: hypothetical protein IAA07_00280 [Candidatus Lachnoclostridium stercoravium]|uniref:Uncharacterized protein n=1 Tax=Candidatus Lachnoclostridium stercoravium TaxID=2838633 RepID=A0A9D2KN76_9FIRM|nr:hypothetical protein [Candidatus Lachnoclostridium stercoravium]